MITRPIRPVVPYFQENDITIYHGECLDVLSKLNLGDRVLLFTDPPYGIGAGTKTFTRANKQTGKSLAKCKDYGNKEWDNKPPPPEYFEYVLKNTKDQIIFGGNYFIEWLYNTSCMLFWDKLNGDNNYADGELAWTSFTSALRIFKFQWHGMLQQTRRGMKEIRVHPTQKPVGLAKEILKKYYDKEKYDMVLDTHMGSGSFGVACKELGIPYIGIDTELEYCVSARFRLASVQRISEFTVDKKGFLF
jgi:site-specific DNA-methyltransferase (adenine-specific)